MILKKSTNKLSINYFNNKDVIDIAKSLVGKILCTNIKNNYTSGIIVETEAYKGINDRASHAYGGKKTSRNHVMYKMGGTIYVYICYGIHHLFNIVCNETNIPDAVLIRAIQPVEGIDIMLRRTNKTSHRGITSGPGKLSQALGIDKKLNGVSIIGDNLWVETSSFRGTIVESERIGVEYAEKDSKLLRRFYMKGNEYISVK